MKDELTRWQENYIDVNLLVLSKLELETKVQKLETELSKLRYSQLYLLYIYFACLFVCLFVYDKRQNGRTDRARILCVTSHDPRKALCNIKIGRKKSWKI